MYGISGIWERGGCSLRDLERRLAAIIQSLRHRGADDHGLWLSEEAPLPSGGVALHLSTCPEWDINQFSRPTSNIGQRVFDVLTERRSFGEPRENVR
jgi:hypothetical protein